MRKFRNVIFQPTRPLRGATLGCGYRMGSLGFQPTRPLRGATARRRAGAMWRRYFNPRAPCGARPRPLPVLCGGYCISTHAPLAGRDAHGSITTSPGSVFQPTRPLRGATASLLQSMGGDTISTHAPLAGSDRRLSSALIRRSRFQPTRPLRGATRKRAGNSARSRWNFNPRAPCGARRNGQSVSDRIQPISTHAPLAGRDGHRLVIIWSKNIFQPTRPLRGATCCPNRDCPIEPNFNPRAPCGARLIAPQILGAL